MLRQDIVKLGEQFGQFFLLSGIASMTCRFAQRFGRNSPPLGPADEFIEKVDKARFVRDPTQKVQSTMLVSRQGNPAKQISSRRAGQTPRRLVLALRDDVGQIGERRDSGGEEYLSAAKQGVTNLG
jgi:hypothetical protein